jgi:hypothetical protein
VIAQTQRWSMLLLPALIAPWIVAAGLVWSGRDRDSLPLSMADAARRRLWNA